MPLPPLYKYLDIDGAKKTLSGQCFKHAKPSTFNDKEDLTVASMFPGDLADALKSIQANLGQMILTNINRPAACASPSMRHTVTKLQDIFRANPKAALIFIEELKKHPELLKLDVSNVEQLAQSTIDGVNEMMQRHRVFCVTTEKDDEKMWSGYAQDHKGIALRVLAGAGRDSKFELFKPVSYRQNRPTIYRDGSHFMSATLFDDQEASARATMHDITYTKTLDWQHEKEYRLVIPLDEGEKDWSLLKFFPEEITELYLGLAMDDADRTEIVETAAAINPAIVMFQMNRDAGGRLVPEAVT